MAIEIVDFPIQDGDFHWFSIAMLNYQRVDLWIDLENLKERRVKTLSGSIRYCVFSFFFPFSFILGDSRNQQIHLHKICVLNSSLCFSSCYRSTEKGWQPRRSPRPQNHGGLRDGLRDDLRAAQLGWPVADTSSGFVRDVVQRCLKSW